MWFSTHLEQKVILTVLVLVFAFTFTLTLAAAVQTPIFAAATAVSPPPPLHQLPQRHHQPSLPGVSYHQPSFNRTITSAPVSTDDAPDIQIIETEPQTQSHQTQQYKHAAAVRHKCRQLALLGGRGPGRSVLQAVCSDAGDGEGHGWWLTSLNLNKCLGYSNDELVFESSGNYDKFCRPCGINLDKDERSNSSLTIKCACRRPANNNDEGNDGVAQFTQLSLTEHDHLGIQAIKGRLVCGNHRGTKSPYFERRPRLTINDRSM